jgi:hypothetical protein
MSGTTREQRATRKRCCCRLQKCLDSLFIPRRRTKVGCALFAKWKLRALATYLSAANLSTWSVWQINDKVRLSRVCAAALPQTSLVRAPSGGKKCFTYKHFLHRLLKQQMGVECFYYLLSLLHHRVSSSTFLSTP